MKKKIDVCIAGGGPAGMVLGLCLAQQGVNVLVVEKNRDFTREYRGEVLMPRFTQMFRQLGLDGWLDSLTHLKLKFGEIYFQRRLIGAFDFSNATAEAPYARWMPQKVLLDGLHERAKAFPNFEIWFGASVKKLTKNGERVTGAVVHRGNENIEVEARVTVGSDGRYSTVLKEGKFEIEYENYNFDILWFNIPKPDGYENTFRILFSTRRNFLLLPKYPDSIQAGILVDPHELSKMREAGIENLRAELKAGSPLFWKFADELKDFTPFHPLQAHLHMVKRWAKDGCLVIGDAAHCCSPAGAVGVSMAVGTAIVAADVIAKALRGGEETLSAATLDEVQRTREPDVRRVHRIQRRITGGRVGRFIPVRILLPIIVTLLARTPLFRRMQRRLMALPAPLPISSEMRF